MISWVHITLIVALTGILVLLFLLIFQECLNPKTRKIMVTAGDVDRVHNLQNGNIAINDHETNVSMKTSPNIFRWADHPSLVTDAVENGWSRFAFTMSSSPSGSRSGVYEISWEVSEGSADYMQRVSLNPGLTTVNSSVSVIRTALPLPGPHLGNSSFPQEAYFEITILPGGNRVTDDKDYNDGSEEKIKLIEEDFNAKISNDFRTTNSNIDENSENEAVLVISVGLTGGGTLPTEIPGSFPGSIGFNSTGSVYLDGNKLVSESEKGEWERPEKVVVIGCGYNPGQRRVFFTVDSELVHEIQCNSSNEEFSSPLYPTLAANADLTILVNLGQSPFQFEPANLQRTPNPCFVRLQQAKSNDFGSEDSNDLFSIGRIDSQWLQWSAIRSNSNTVNSIKSLEFDLESDSDLFEINLDSTIKTPYTTTSNL